MAHYDILVIGSGPAGQKAAIQAAKIGKKVAIIERKKVAGGICINIGTIPSKSLREAVMFLSGFRQRNLYGASYRVKKDITFEDLAQRCDHVVKAEQEIIQNQLIRNCVDFIVGTAAVIDPHRIAIKQDSETNEHTADYIVIAVGTEAARPPDKAAAQIPNDSRRRRDRLRVCLYPGHPGDSGRAGGTAAPAARIRR